MQTIYLNKHEQGEYARHDSEERQWRFRVWHCRRVDLAQKHSHHAIKLLWELCVIVRRFVECRRGGAHVDALGSEVPRWCCLCRGRGFGRGCRSGRGPSGEQHAGCYVDAGGREAFSYNAGQDVNGAGCGLGHSGLAHA